MSTGQRVFRVVATGELSRGDFARTVDEHYSLIGDRDILWDLRGADMSKMMREDFMHVAACTSAKLTGSTHRKIACVTSDAATYTRLCSYITIAFQAGVPAEYSVFLDLRDAEQWLARR